MLLRGDAIDNEPLAIYYDSNQKRVLNITSTDVVKAIRRTVREIYNMTDEDELSLFHATRFESVLAAPSFHKKYQQSRSKRPCVGRGQSWKNYLRDLVRIATKQNAAINAADGCIPNLQLLNLQ